MKKLVFLYLLFFLIKLVSAQSKPISNVLTSLTEALTQAQSDTERVAIYIKLMKAAPTKKAAIDYGKKGLVLAKQIRYIEGSIRCGNQLGFLLIDTDYYRAIPLLMETKQLCERVHNQYELARSLGYLGLAYNKFDPKKSISYYRQCERLMKKENISETVVPISTFIGFYYKDYGQLDSALVYLNKGFLLASQSEDYPIRPRQFYRFLGQVYYKKGQPDQAMHYFRESMTALNEKTDGETYEGIALLFRDKNQLDSAKYYAKRALQVEQKRNRASFIIQSAELLSALYKPTDPVKALHYQILASAAKDSLFDQEKARQLEKLAFDEQESEARIKRRIEAHQTEYEDQLKIYALSALLMGLALVAFFLYRNNQTKQKANNLLHRQKQEIDAQKASLEVTLTELKATQKQLIQKEKMASLGELTAGIAHEIQNPLNFVNNFSEVSAELLDELKHDISADHKDDALALTDDLIQNLQKISQHGHRASSIVKGMLEHSRTSSGEREPTNLNALADEYFRLAYHGLRAKDHTFNCELVSHFDPTLGKVKVMSQEMGRVLLNLFNNAFYAVHEKQKTAPPDYQPTVTVRTSQLDKVVEIRISDNGTGIPERVREKIFQPFFTTKPTGEGTGLGLSLAYDIVTKGHGGDISVTSNQGEGTEFIIHLPTTTS